MAEIVVRAAWVRVLEVTRGDHMPEKGGEFCDARYTRALRRDGIDYTLQSVMIDREEK